MSAAIRRVASVVTTDLRVRVRRTSTLVLLFVLCALPYRFVPPSFSGRTPMIVDGHRALLSSSVIALSTACLGSIFLAMLGFYLVSSTIRRDIISRVGSIVAATPITNGEYLAGKLLGNVGFLALIAGFYMLSVMGLHLLRGEGPMEPGVYFATYVAVMGPTVVVVASLALLFECARPLSGRFGDAVYFLVWTAMVSLTALWEPSAATGWFDFADVLGMIFMLRQVSEHGLHEGISVGNMAFDGTLTPWIFPGIRWNATALATRLGSASVAVPVFVAAGLLFSRFDPVKIRAPDGRTGRGVSAAIHAVMRPLTGGLVRLLRWVPGNLIGLTLGEVLLTAMLSPLLLVLMVVLAGWGMAAPMGTLGRVVVPASFVVLALAIAGIGVRDADAGTRALLWTAPGVKRSYYAGKLAAAALIATMFVAVPLVRIAAVNPASATSLMIGALWSASLAVALGRVSGSAKLFSGGFLFFLYLVLSANTAPAFDFAGWNGVATNRVRVGYAVATILLAVVSTLPRVRSPG